MDNFTPLSYQDTVSTLNLIKTDKHMSEPLIVKWVTQILRPPSSIISQLLKDIFSPKATLKVIERNYALIRKLLLICHSDTAKELSASPGLSCDIIAYIAYTAKSALCQDSLCVLYEVGKAEEDKPFLTEKFVKALFDLLDAFNDEENFKAAIRLLIAVNSSFEPCDDNYFLKVYHFHCNSRFFDEAALRLLNNEAEPVRMRDIIHCIVLILESEKRIVFYASDLEVFIDITLRQLQMVSFEELRYCFIDAIHKVVVFEEYHKTMYKAEEIVDLIETVLESDHQTQRIKRKCKAIFRAINRIDNKEENDDIQSCNDDETSNSNIDLSLDNEEEGQLF